MPLFSIIIPVYNAEKTLSRCLISILAQTEVDFEILLIENGSGDSSGEICGKFAAADSRVKLHIRETNCGPSGARNIGLEHAKGKYITFVDSDDYVETDYLASVKQALENTDVAFLGYHRVLEDGSVVSTHIPDFSESDNYYERLLQLYKQDLFGYTWIKAFRRGVIGEHRFSEELNLLEDEVFTCDILTSPKRVAVIPKAIYNYVSGNSGSLIGRTHQDYCRIVDQAYLAWMRLLDGSERKTAVLESMAKAHVNRCIYYGFEREVNIEAFFGSLAESAFFQNASVTTGLCGCVRERNYRRLSWMRTLYRLKIKIARLLRR